MWGLRHDAPEEEIAPFQLGQPIGWAVHTLRHIQDSLTQPRAQPVQNSTVQEKGTHFGRLGNQHLLTQVGEEPLPDVVQVGGETAESVGSQPQGGYPSLGAGGQLSDLGRAEIQTGGSLQKRGHLLVGESEFGGTEFQQLAPNAQAGQRERGVHPRQQVEMPINRKVLHQILKHFLAIQAGQMLQVIEDDNEHGRVQRSQCTYQEAHRPLGGSLQSNEITDFVL